MLFRNSGIRDGGLCLSVSCPADEGWHVLEMYNIKLPVKRGTYSCLAWHPCAWYHLMARQPLVKNQGLQVHCSSALNPRMTRARPALTFLALFGSHACRIYPCSPLCQTPDFLWKPSSRVKLCRLRGVGRTRSRTLFCYFCAASSDEFMW